MDNIVVPCFFDSQCSIVKTKSVCTGMKYYEKKKVALPVQLLELSLSAYDA